MVNDIHILDVRESDSQLEKLQWNIPQIEGKTQPRMGHSAQLYDGKIVIFGGWNGFKVLDDVVFIDLKNGTQNLHFNSPQVKGEPPRRQFHTANIIEDNMYVFGGGDAKYWLNDLDMLNLSMLFLLHFRNVVVDEV